MNSKSVEETSLSRIRAAIDEALRSRLRLQEARVEMLAQQCQGLETSEIERALLEAREDSDRAIRALNAQLLTAEC
jgi:hypothetical protein